MPKYNYMTLIRFTKAADVMTKDVVYIDGDKSVADAIKIGEILSENKANMAGRFLAWISTLPFSDRTAQRYMQLYAHRDKTATLSDLQTAYKQVESFEEQERKTDDQKARERVTAYLKTGKKPEGWRRETDDKLAKERRESNEAFEAQQAKWKLQNEERMRASEAKPTSPHIDVDALLSNARAVFAEQAVVLQKRITFKEKIRVSHEGKDDPFVDAIMDYLDSLGDDNRRVEACYNIIKVCKRIAIEIQQAVQA